MTARRLMLVGTLLAAPAILSAQGRRRGGDAGGGASSDAACGTSAKDSGVKCDITKDPVKPVKNDPFSTKNLEKENMVAFVLDKKKDLKLTDDEVKALKGINDHVKDTTRAPMKSLDSISGELRRGGDFKMAQVFGPQYVAEVHAQYDDALKQALAKLTDEQQKSANELVENRRKELAPKPEKP